MMMGLSWAEKSFVQPFKTQWVSRERHSLDTASPRIPVGLLTRTDSECPSPCACADFEQPEGKLLCVRAIRSMFQQRQSIATVRRLPKVLAQVDSAMHNKCVQAERQMNVQEL